MHHRTRFSGYIFATKACVDNLKKLVKQQYLLHTSSQYELTALHSEFMNTPNIDFLNVHLCSAPMSYLAGSKWGPVVLRARRNALVLAPSTRCLRRAHSIGRGCRVRSCVMAIGADFQMYLLLQFCSNRQYTGDTDAKNDGPEF